MCASRLRRLWPAQEAILSAITRVSPLDRTGPPAWHIRCGPALDSTPAESSRPLYSPFLSCLGIGSKTTEGANAFTRNRGQQFMRHRFAPRRIVLDDQGVDSHRREEDHSHHVRPFLIRKSPTRSRSHAPF